MSSTYNRRGLRPMANGTSYDPSRSNKGKVDLASTIIMGKENSGNETRTVHATLTRGNRKRAEFSTTSAQQVTTLALSPNELQRSQSQHATEQRKQRLLQVREQEKQAAAKLRETYRRQLSEQRRLVTNVARAQAEDRRDAALSVLEDAELRAAEDRGLAHREARQQVMEQTLNATRDVHSWAENRAVTDSRFSKALAQERAAVRVVKEKREAQVALTKSFREQDRERAHAWAAKHRTVSAQDQLPAPGEDRDGDAEEEGGAQGQHPEEYNTTRTHMYRPIPESASHVLDNREKSIRSNGAKAMAIRKAKQHEQYVSTRADITHSRAPTHFADDVNMSDFQSHPFPALELSAVAELPSIDHLAPVPAARALNHHDDAPHPVTAQPRGRRQNVQVRSVSQRSTSASGRSRSALAQGVCVVTRPVPSLDERRGEVHVVARHAGDDDEEGEEDHVRTEPVPVPSAIPSEVPSRSPQRAATTSSDVASTEPFQYDVPLLDKLAGRSAAGVFLTTFMPERRSVLSTHPRSETVPSHAPEPAQLEPTMTDHVESVTVNPTAVVASEPMITTHPSPPRPYQSPVANSPPTPPSHHSNTLVSEAIEEGDDVVLEDGLSDMDDGMHSANDDQSHDGFEGEPEQSAVQTVSPPRRPSPTSSPVVKPREVPQFMSPEPLSLRQLSQQQSSLANAAASPTVALWGMPVRYQTQGSPTKPAVTQSSPQREAMEPRVTNTAVSPVRNHIDRFMSSRREQATSPIKLISPIKHHAGTVTSTAVGGTDPLDELRIPGLDSTINVLATSVLDSAPVQGDEVETTRPAKPERVSAPVSAPVSTAVHAVSLPPVMTASPEETATRKETSPWSYTKPSETVAEVEPLVTETEAEEAVEGASPTTVVERPTSDNPFLHLNYLRELIQEQHTYLDGHDGTSPTQDNQVEANVSADNNDVDVSTEVAAEEEGDPFTAADDILPNMSITDTEDLIRQLDLSESAAEILRSPMRPEELARMRARPVVVEEEEEVPVTVAATELGQSVDTDVSDSESDASSSEDDIVEEEIDVPVSQDNAVPWFMTATAPPPVVSPDTEREQDFVSPTPVAEEPVPVESAPVPVATDFVWANGKLCPVRREGGDAVSPTPGPILRLKPAEPVSVPVVTRTAVVSQIEDSAAMESPVCVAKVSATLRAEIALLKTEQYSPSAHEAVTSDDVTVDTTMDAAPGDELGGGEDGLEEGASMHNVSANPQDISLFSLSSMSGDELEQMQSLDVSDSGGKRTSTNWLFEIAPLLQQGKQRSAGAEPSQPTVQREPVSVETAETAEEGEESSGSTSTASAWQQGHEDTIEQFRVDMRSFVSRSRERLDDINQQLARSEKFIVGGDDNAENSATALEHARRARAERYARRRQAMQEARRTVTIEEGKEYANKQWNQLPEVQQKKLAKKRAQERQRNSERAKAYDQLRRQRMLKKKAN